MSFLLWNQMDMTHSCNSQHMVTGQTQIDVSGVNKGKYDRNGRKRIWGNSQKGEILPLLLMGGTRFSHGGWWMCYASKCRFNRDMLENYKDLETTFIR